MKTKGLTLLLLLVLAVTGCSNISMPSEEAPNQDSPAPIEQEKDPIKELIQEMTLEEKIGQLVIVGVEGYELDSLAQEMIDKYKVGGFILFGRNIRDYHQTLELVNALKKANSTNKIPLFLAVDEEGGLVSRMPPEFHDLPTGREVGRVNNPEFAYKIGELLGEQLQALGLNMNFAPVLDIDSNPNNPVIGERAFGPDAERVAKLGISTMKGIQRGAIAVVKHFPGHGDTEVDSHVGLPVINHSLERIKSFELVPFKRAIEAGAEAVMVAHIVLEKLDPQYPATLSASIISEMLRQDLNFDGVVITDDMTMGAIVENYALGGRR